jgi:hypothetical protein
MSLQRVIRVDVHPEKWEPRYSRLERILTLMNYVEQSRNWVTVADAVSQTGISRKTAWRFMCVLERVRGYEVMGGRFPGDKLMWRAPR